MLRHKAFRWFTFALLFACIGAVYENVISDDSAVRAQARRVVGAAAGCDEDCKLEGLRGERGMLDETIDYDVLRHGHFTVVCKRAFVIVGDYTCTVTSKP